jgi:hypothetical protein
MNSLHAYQTAHLDFQSALLIDPRNQYGNTPCQSTMPLICVPFQNPLHGRLTFIAVPCHSCPYSHFFYYFKYHLDCVIDGTGHSLSIDKFSLLLCVVLVCVCVCLLIYILSLLKIKGEKSFYQIKWLDELKLVKMCEQCKCIVCFFARFGSCGNRSLHRNVGARSFACLKAMASASHGGARRGQRRWWRS